MNEKYTDLELQLWLAEELPQDIKVHVWRAIQDTFEWRGAGGLIREREWYYITHEVIKKLSWEQKSKMNDILYEITPADKCMWENDWQTLAVAYSMTIGKIKE